MELTAAHRRALVAVLVLVVAVVGVQHVLRHGSSNGTHVALIRPAKRASPARQELVVDVAGAVRRPGLVHIAQGTRVADALAAAGGSTPRADLAAVNLAAPLADGEQVVVPLRGAAGAPASGPAATAPVDLNTATPEQLDALPGIGPATAAKIVAFRTAHGPFRSVDELVAVPGIGPARIEQLKGLVLP